jgi:ribosomal protein S18 acetylase RimI-like enzyme
LSRKLPPKTKDIIAEVDNKVVGFCDVGPSRDDDANEYTGEVYGIYVKPDYMHRGIGSTLLESGLNYLREKGLKVVTLWVLEANSNTRKFYEKHGSVLTGRKRPKNAIWLYYMKFNIGSFYYTSPNETCTTLALKIKME